MLKQNLLTIPVEIGIIHLVGIGGIGMSGIAEILHNMGYEVSGSDLKENANTKRLEQLGIKIYIGHNVENIKNAGVVVKSTAVSFANPEIIAASERQIPVIRRSEMIAELTKMKATIAVTGAHGKTTTTSMIAQIFHRSGLQPTVINGGVINSFGSNAHYGKSDWFIAEADESDGTFIRFPSTIGVITNIDLEHMEFWKSEERLYSAYQEFVNRLPFYGFAVLNADDKKVNEIAKSTKNRKIYTYSIQKHDENSKEQPSINLASYQEQHNGIEFNFRLNDKNLLKNANISLPEDKTTNIFSMFLPVFGLHNISNSLAAICVSLVAGISIEQIKLGLKAFAGVKRRFTILGTTKDNLTFVDDYAHHPVEVNATIKAAKDYIKNTRDNKGRVVIVMQPHRYTRLEACFKEFASVIKQADIALLTEVYSAGEKEINGVNQHSLKDYCNDKNIIALEKDDEIYQKLIKVVKSGDVILFLGAGSISNYAQEIFDKFNSCNHVTK